MPLKFGVIGVGIQGEAHVKILQSLPHSEVVAVCDVNEGRAREVAERHGVKRWYADFRKMLEAEELDAVTVATPDPFHFEPAMAAIEARKHLLVEKPLATTVEEAERLVEAAREAGVTLYVNFSNRFMPQMVLTKKLVDEGELGEPVYAFARLSNTLYVPLRMIRGWAERTSLPFWLMSHTIDRVRWLFGREIRSVFARTHEGVLKAKGLDVKDLYVALVEFEGGAVGTFESLWILPDSRPNIVDSRMDLVFSEGTVSFDTISPAPQVATKDGFEMPYPLQYDDAFGRPVGMVTESLRHFVECLAEGREPITTGEDGLRAVKVAAAILQSAEEGRPIEVG